MLTRLGVAVFLSMGVMVFSMYLYGQRLYDHDPSQGAPLSASLTGLMRYLSLAFATPVFFILGVPIFRNAAAQWRQGIASTDALVVLGVAGAFVYSYISTLTDRGDTYYETACMILVLVTLGRWLEANGKLRASRAVEALEALIPTDVSVLRGGRTFCVPVQDVRVGDRIVVPAGERVPVDGAVESGRAQVNEQIVTGESEPVEKRAGDAVHAGAVSLDGALAIRATAVGQDATLGRLLVLLEAAKRSKGRYERYADRVAAAFVPVTIAVAAFGAALGFVRGGWAEAIMSGLAVTLIACPCALGIATPMAIWVSLGRAAMRGVLFRNGEAIETLARVGAVCFDKTGTLTTGRPTVSRFVARDDDGVDESRALAVAAGLGRVSTHAVSHGIGAWAGRRGVPAAEATDVRIVPGRGLTGRTGDDEVSLGNIALMQERSLAFDGRTQEASRQILVDRESIVCVGWGRRVQGVFGLSECLRPEAREAIDALGTMGCRLTVLTGDHAQRGRATAEALGIETLAELTPEDKVRHVVASRRDFGTTAMVGDGLNDAPALAAADVGIAMGCGADVTRESGGVCLLGSDLTMLPWSIRLARRTVRTIKINLFWAFVYNAVGMSLAVAGRLNPIFAAGAMAISSLLVVANSLRLSRETPEVAR